MKSNRIFSITFASFAFFTFAFFASPAKAQVPDSTGSFTLPYEVIWQGTQLPSGDYTFRMDSKAFPARMTVWGPNGGVFVSTIGISTDRASDQSGLQIQNRDGKHYVCDLYIAAYNLHFRYNVPKMKDLHREVLLAQGPSSTDHLPVLHAHK